MPNKFLVLGIVICGILLLGLSISLLIWSYRRTKRIPTSRRSPTEQTVLLEALIQLQYIMELFRSSAEGDLTLADVADLLGSIQLDFGSHTSLEEVIQSLVIQDVLRQLTKPRHRVSRSAEAPAAPTVEQVAEVA